MGKRLVTEIGACFECFYCTEANTKQKDTCFHEGSPGGEDCTVIEDIGTIPEWCPLEDLDCHLGQSKTGRTIYDEIANAESDIYDLNKAINKLNSESCKLAMDTLVKLKSEKMKEVEDLIKKRYRAW